MASIALYSIKTILLGNTEEVSLLDDVFIYSVHLNLSHLTAEIKDFI